MKKLVLLLLLCWSGYVYGQEFSTELDLKDSTQVHFLELKTKEQFIGRVVSVENLIVVFDSEIFGRKEFAYKEIDRVGVKGDYLWDRMNDAIDEEAYHKASGIGREEEYAKYKYGKRSYKEMKKRFTTRDNRYHVPSKMVYFQTAFPREKGGFRYENLNLLLNEISYGVSSYVTIGAGTVFPVIAYARARLNFPISDKLHAGLATTLGGIIFDGGARFSHTYGIVTYGTPALYLNATGGMTSVRDESVFGDGFRRDTRPMFSIGVGGGKAKFHYKVNLMIRVRESGELGYSLLGAWGFYKNNKEYEIGLLPTNFAGESPGLSLLPFFCYRSYF